MSFIFSSILEGLAWLGYLPLCRGELIHVIEHVITLIGILLFINAIFSKLDPAKRENSLQPSQAAIRLLKRIEGTDEFAESEREETD